MCLLLVSDAKQLLVNCCDQFPKLIMLLTKKICMTYMTESADENENGVRRGRLWGVVELTADVDSAEFVLRQSKINK